MMGLFSPLLSAILVTMSVMSRAEDAHKEFLDAHNAARAVVGVAPLAWNSTLAEYAQEFANKVKQTCDNTAESSGPYGENTASGYGAFTTTDAVNQWVEEKVNYDHHLNSCVNGTTECKHYKQVVWRRSVHLGCASVLCGAGWPFVVCEYDPPGNIPGQWPY